MDIVTKERTQNLGVIDTNVTQVAESSCGLWALRGYVTRAYDLPFSLNLFLPQDPLLFVTVWTADSLVNSCVEAKTVMYPYVQLCCIVVRR
jgi:hypothetical protein